MRTRVARILPPLLVLAAFLGAWELYVDLGGVDSLLLPAPHTVAQALWTDRGTLWHNFIPTAEEVLLGILLAMGAAFATAVLIHFAPSLRQAVYPLLAASQAIPIVLIAPLLVFWLGFGILPKLIVVALVSFFPVVVTTMAALEAVDPDLRKLMRTFDASPLQTFRRVELPAALPGLLTGAKIAAVIAVIGAYLGEGVGGDRGLGYLFTLATSQLLAPEAFAAATVLSLFAIALFALFAVLERRALPWAHQPTGDP